MSVFTPTEADLARAAKLSAWWQRRKDRRFEYAKNLMRCFVIIGFPFSILTAWQFYVAGMFAMAAFWLLWALITAAIPLYVAHNAKEAV